jgi:arabinose-5-phosphate isomerase
VLIDIARKSGLRLAQSDASIISRGRTVIETEAAALAQLSVALDDNFALATELILDTRGRVVVTGMGKSGHIGRKLAATLASTGTPAIFVHPAEAAHGDLGMLMAGDVLIVLSNSGATSELKTILRHAKTLNCPIIGIAGQLDSPVMHAADAKLLLPAAREACPANIAPTTSTTLMLALGDALSISVMGVRGISREGLKALHPGGVIGNRLLPVNELMHVGDNMPLVPAAMPMREVVIAITQKSFGIAGVVDADGKLVGVITDGDLRRHVERLLMSTAADVMTTGPKTIPEGTYVEDALAIMNANKITSLFVMRHDAPEIPAGLVHIHDFSRLGLI